MFRVSCIQLRSNNNVHHNLKRTTILIKKAVLQKTDFILTPEVSSQFSLKKNELLKTCTSMNRDICLLYTSPSPRDCLLSRMPSSA